MKGPLENRRARMAWRGAVAATILNVIGMPIDIVIGRSVPSMPLWPIFGSIVVGLVLLGVLLLRRHHASVFFSSLIFLLNTISIALCLWLNAGWFATASRGWAPFQANKLGALTVALLTPELWVGIVSILIYSGSAIFKLYLFAPEVRDRLPLGEPWASVAFGLFGVALLLHRLRQFAVERRMIRAQAQAAALEKVARELMAVRDLANTPIQNIEINAKLLARYSSDEAKPFVERIQRALERLRESCGLLASYEVKWRSGDESFDPRARLPS